jgi:putative oxygen-independent coproporphyrinogen III oxidase
MSAAHPFGLYVHWPYCKRLCPYCDFNIYRHRGTANEDLLSAILADIEGHGTRIEAPGPLHSLSFGGGTPSLMTPAQINAVIDTAERVFGFTAHPEISLEANPDGLSLEVCKGFTSAGINRLSIGVQSLNDVELKFLGRDHSAKDARNAIEAGRAAGMRISADFIYDLPDQSIDDWNTGLDAALALKLEHYSFYALTIEPGTAFGVQAKKGRLNLPPEARSAVHYDLTQQRTHDAGLPAYEVSNHATGPAAQSVHNLIYWQNGDWVGVGPGAHGRVNIDGQRMAIEAVRRPDAYCAAVKATGWGAGQHSRLSPQDIAMEALLMGLRLRTGIDIEALQQSTGFALPAQKLHSLIAQDLLAKAGVMLRVQPKGWALIDRLVLELMA